MLLAIIPNDLETLNNLAYLLAEDMKKPKDALTFAQRAVDLMRAGKVDLSFSNNGSLYDTLGWVKYLDGNNNGAITELKTSLNVELSVIAYLPPGEGVAEERRHLRSARGVGCGNPAGQGAERSDAESARGLVERTGGQVDSHRRMV